MSLVEFKDITKSYVVDRNGQPQIISACQKISFQIQKNTIHALIGENGAGKSTLMKILAGVEIADSGEIFIRNEKYEPKSATDAHKFKIGIVHQHFMLAENLTVLDHLILNWPKQSLFRKKSILDIKSAITEIEKKFNWRFKLNIQIKNLSVGDQQRLEILKALLVKPEIIIFDEPTAVLSPQEIKDFLKFISELKKQGHAVILITHKLHEVKVVADTVTVLRRGQCVASKAASDLSIDQLAELMIGERLRDVRLPEKKIASKVGAFHFKNIPFDIQRGEIFGVAGVDGNGQSELIQKILAQLKMDRVNYADISEDRYALCLFQGLTLVQHMILSHPRTLTKWGFILQKESKKTTAQLLADWDIRPPEIDMKIENLSGGNQQKFIVAKELYKDPDFILAAYPTRGVDLLAQQKIQAAFVEFAYQKNRSVFLISSDLDEILKFSDRYIILSSGQINGPFLRNQLNESEIGQLMAGPANVN